MNSFEIRKNAGDYGKPESERHTEHTRKARETLSDCKAHLTEKLYNLTGHLEKSESAKQQRLSPGQGEGSRDERSRDNSEKQHGESSRAKSRMSFTECKSYLAEKLDPSNENNKDAEKASPEKKGGSYKDVRNEGEGDKYEVHHMPADSASPLERNDGPAIKMEKDDHRQTASCGMSREAREYRRAQEELIKQGKFREALQMDIDDIREKFGNKYDDAIKEMLEYVDQLESEGRI